MQQKDSSDDVADLTDMDEPQSLLVVEVHRQRVLTDQSISRHTHTVTSDKQHNNKD